jgi:hypothetical protein
MVVLSSALIFTLFDPGYGLTASARYEHFNFTSAESFSQLSEIVTPSDAYSKTTAEKSETEQILFDQPTVTEPEKRPSKVILEDGTSFSWDALSAKDQHELQKAMEEVRMAVAEINKEVIEKFQSDEFKEQMRQVNEEVRRAMEEMNRELTEKLQSEEFRLEIRMAGEEARRAGEEARKAIEEANREMKEYFQSEDFKQEMKQAREEVRKAMKELEDINWEGYGETLRMALEEAGKGLQDIGPIVEDAFKELNIDQIIKEVMDSVNKAMEEVEKKKNEE